MCGEARIFVYICSCIKRFLSFDDLVIVVGAGVGMSLVGR